MASGMIETVLELDRSLPMLLLDEARLQQVLINLLTNAVQAMTAGGKLLVRTRRETVPQTGWLVPGRFKPGTGLLIVEIDDSGEGIPAEVLPKIFDPFFTTKPTGQGTGLGLSVTRTLVELHQGAIDLRNRPEGGIRATLAFPLQPASS